MRLQLTALAVVLAVLLIPLIGSNLFNQSPSAHAASTSLTFTPVADAYVYESNPTNNYGSSLTLRLDGSPIMRSYLRFNVQGLSGAVTGATLRVYANSTSDAGFTAARLSDNSWTESTLTYNNAPALGTIINSSVVPGAGTWVTIDVTPYITGTSSWDLVLSAGSLTQVSLASREDAAHAPQLVVTTDSTGPTATTAPPTATPTRTAMPSTAPTAASTSSAAPTNTPSPTPTSVPPTNTSTPTNTPANTLAPTNTPTKTATPAGYPGGIPTFDHIFVLLEENHSYSQIIGSASAPYLNSLANQNGLATNYYAVAHPSLPDYLALIGGSTFGVTTDCAPSSCPVNAVNLADRIEASGRTWKSYQESMPRPCGITTSGNYAPKHNPFVYFNDIRTNSARCNAHVVPYTALSTDLSTAATTPDFVWITPNLCNDMHSCAVGTGDTWLKNQLPMIFNSPAWTAEKSVLFIVWDEDGGGAGNHVAALVIGPSVIPGYQSTVSYTHYGLLHTIEQAWSLTALTANDASAAPLSDFWR